VCRRGAPRSAKGWRIKVAMAAALGSSSTAEEGKDRLLLWRRVGGGSGSGGAKSGRKRGPCCVSSRPSNESGGAHGRAGDRRQSSRNVDVDVDSSSGEEEGGSESVCMGRQREEENGQVGGHTVVLEGHCTRARCAASVHSRRVDGCPVRSTRAAPFHPLPCILHHRPPFPPISLPFPVHFVIHWLPAPCLRSCLVDALPSRKTSDDISLVLMQTTQWVPSCQDAGARGGWGRRVLLRRPDRKPFRRASLSCTASRAAAGWRPSCILGSRLLRFVVGLLHRR
jgi:hypothetical protein